MMPMGPLKSITIYGPDQTKALTGYLIEQSAWYELMPMPCDEYRIIFKEENYWKVLEFVKELD